MTDHGYDDAFTLLYSPVTEACAYDPTAGTSWQYGTRTLGVGEAVFAGGPWSFKAYFLTIAQGELKVHIHVDGMALRSPQLCDSEGLTTHLGLRLVIDDGLNRPPQILSTAPWRCVTNGDGDVRSLQLPNRDGPS